MHRSHFTASIMGPMVRGEVELTLGSGKIVVRTVSLEQRPYFDRIGRLLPHRFELDDDGIVAWIPRVPSGRGLVQFLKAAGLPEPERLARQVSNEAIAADAVAALRSVPGTVVPEAAVRRIDYWLPAGFAALAETLVTHDGLTAQEIYDLHTAMRDANWDPQSYVSRLREDGFALIESFANWKDAFRLLNRVADAAPWKVRTRAALQAVIVNAERIGHHTVVGKATAIDRAAELLCEGETKATKEAMKTRLGEALKVTKDANGKYSGGVTDIEQIGAKHVGLTKDGKPPQFLFHHPTGFAEVNLAAGLASQIGPCVDARVVLRLLQSIPMSDEQMAVAKALARQRLVVVTGAAGTGKSHVVRLVGESLAAAGMSVQWTATTGRAAKLLHPEGRTVHSFLGIRPGDTHYRTDATPDVLIVDEMSMMDTLTAGPLGRFLADGRVPGRVVFVGDVGQLPPVGPGKVLHEVAGLAGVGLVELKENWRVKYEGTGIVDYALAIRDGKELPVVPGVTVLPDDADALDAIKLRAGGREDTMVVSAEYQGPLGVDALNQVLRDAHLGVSAEPWLVGQHVVQTRTERFAMDGRNVVIANGTFGVVTRVGEDDLDVEYDDEDRTTRTWTKAQCAGRAGVVTSSYALTVHRAQGGQARRVIVVAVGTMWDDRAMGYTAVSRAEQEVVIVGDPNVLRGKPEKGGVERRQTMLLERFARAKRRLAA